MIQRFVLPLGGWLIVAGLAVGAGPASRQSSTQAVSPLLADARRIVAELKSTKYQHKTEIKEGAGQYDCDCSGLVGYLLRKWLPDHYRSIPYGGWHKRPLAGDFYDAFLASPTNMADASHWQRIDSLLEARAGDIMAWKKIDADPDRGSTGHVVLVDGPAQKVSEDVYALAVIDSTTAAHSQDTRKKGQSGVGRGVMYFQVDVQGHPVAHAHRSEKGPWIVYPHAIARPLGS